MERSTSPRRRQSSWAAFVASAPFKIFFSLLSNVLLVIRPFAPRLIPLLVFSLFIPLIVTCSIGAGWLVWSSLLVSWKVPLHLQYGDGIPPYAYAALPKLNSYQPYDISVDLLVPFTNSNLLLGNFMTSLTLFASSNKTLAYVRRPAIVPTPSFTRFKRTGVHVKVPMLESFEADSPSLFASVEIGRHDGWALLGDGQGRELSVISASLRGVAVPHGIRGLAIRFRLLSAAASAIVFLLILSLIVAFCLLPLILRTPTENTEDEDNAEINEASDSQTVSSRESRRRRRSRSSSERASIKREAPVQATSSVDSPTKKLRKRSSKPAVGTSETEI